ncbi:hypothetical protein IOC57_19360 [Bacillus sp. SD075]|uniref:hypothetical protein n=1 Tax=Bacillus sp. SD075 TaxID=2781732 RepID=UPI001A969E47|nr:hypothetical protein [Bacillus sp. SD075]MBO0999892.1 hypothetical protein [Bacillus sp. SD075]
MTTKQKAEFCKHLNYQFELKKGWHIIVSWEARNRLNRDDFIDFMTYLGWEKNLYGMLRYYDK